MTPPPAAAEAEAILEQSGWVRELARRLVRDPHLAEDLAQETCLAALEHRPRAEGLRAWLATVLRNLVRQVARLEGRRQERELAAAPTPDAGSPLELLERLSVHAKVVESVRRLEEPYRTVILLRYFEGLAPSAIAGRLGVPVSTVKTRLARGLERLRGRLESERAPDGRSWLAALIPLTWKSGGVTAQPLGALLVSTQIKLALAGLVAAAGALVLWNGRGDAPEPSVAAAAPLESAPQARAPRPTVNALAATPTAATRVDAVAPQEPAQQAEPVTPPPGPAPLIGRTVDTEGRTLPGELVRFEGELVDPLTGVESHGERDVLAGPDGRFVLEDVGRGRLTAAGPRRATVLAASARRDRQGAEPIVVVAPGIELAGVVLDELGRPLADARVALALPDGLRAGLTWVLDRSDPVSFSAVSDAEGRFQLGLVPIVEAARLSAHLEGYDRWEASEPAFDDAGLTIVLSRPQPLASSLTGLVVDPAGRPVPEASVSFGLDSTRTDEGGRFAFDLLDERSPNAWSARRFGAPPPRHLMAFKPGARPAHQDVPLDAEGRPQLQGEVVLVLGGAPLEIAGRVLDATGLPLEGMQVWVADVTLFGLSGAGPTVLENELAGQSDRRWAYVTSDADGRFELGGLDAREYTLEAMDPLTLVRATPSRAEAGSRAVELIVPADAFWKRVEGRVRSRSGEPLPGVSVRPMCDPFRLRYQGQVVSTSHSSLDPVVTDEDGRFELERVPRELVYLRLDGEEIVPLEYGRHVEGGLGELSQGRLDELDIVVPLRVRLSVVLDAPDEADAIAVLDETGERIVLNIFQASGRRETDAASLTQGRSGVLTATDTAATLVLLREGQEVRRVPLTLSRGAVNEVHP